MTNWYAPGEVKVTKMTEEELAAINDRRKKERKKYKFRNNRKAMADLNAYVAEDQMAVLKRTSNLRK